MNWYDISEPLGRFASVWPGDEDFTTEWTGRLSEGAAANVSTLRMSAHTGTHVDAPRHVTDTGATIDRVPLDVFIGPAVVVDVVGASPITAELIPDRFPPRVLFKTRPDGQVRRGWTPDFAWIDPKAAEILVAGGGVLIGTESPSVDPADSEALPVHHLFARNGMVNLENLVLSGVPAGPYTLIALPLALEGREASPVRAILLRPGVM